MFTASLHEAAARAGRLLGVLVCVAGALAVVAFAAVKALPVPDDAAYVGSTRCDGCHRDEHAGWVESLHPKMMRRVDQPGVVVADLDPVAGDVPFNPTEAVWAIGSKWEQQFMGHDANGETLLPGAWLVDADRWKTTGWDGWQVPVPLQRCHGCHTVGLDVETGEFVEPGVGCESCHGPGSWHADTAGLGRIHVSLDAQVCGQCHTRGRSIDRVHFFPVGYQPGDSLEALFAEEAPSPGQTTTYWWANGRERKRHQEYFAWRQGGHADSLASLTGDYDGRYGEVTADCLDCHSGEGALAGLGIGPSPRLEDARSSITCAVCHEVHGRLDEARLSCAACHGDGAFYHEPGRNAGHVACPEEADVGCVGCHMPLTGLNGGDFTLHSHAPGVVPPHDTTEHEVPNSCANGGCHADRDQSWLEATYERHYAPEGVAQRQSGSRSSTPGSSPGG